MSRAGAKSGKQTEEVLQLSVCQWNGTLYFLFYAGNGDCEARGKDYRSVGRKVASYTNVGSGGDKTFPIVTALRTQFNWSQYCLLIQIDNPDKREYYELKTLNNNGTRREAE
jgi:hypothetical protein